MDRMPAEMKRARDQGRYDCVILVLQGGGALGAYQAGVFEGLTEAEYAPDWVTGVSIGAINGALIAGNPPGRRVERLRAFWDRVSSGIPAMAPAYFDPARQAFNRASAALSAVFGVPGLYTPRVPPPLLAPDGTPGALSVYDTQPLRNTLAELVDFERIDAPDVRLSLGAADLRTGNSVYFDNRQTRLGAEHVMASCALPPAFAPVEIAGRHYCDGGVVSNTPLWYVLDDSPRMNALIFQVDLFSAKGELPRNLDEVMERHKDIQYSSKTRLNTALVAETRRLRNALHRLVQKLPENLKSDADVEVLKSICSDAHIDIVHLINRRYSHTTYSKDFDFSRATVRQLWDAGLEDVRRTLAHPEWLQRPARSGGVRVFDLAREPEPARPLEMETR
jgi:NTE family protein